ncbi:MAG: M24 family metallopeptidase [Pseudomonadota bacterium]
MPQDLPFSRVEYDRRLALVRAAMAGRDIDLLFVTDPSNMAWLTGYDGWSFYVHQGVILGAHGDPIWWGRRQDAAGARATIWMGEAQIVSYDERYIQTPDAHPMEDLARHLQGLDARRIGLELDNYYFSAKAYLVLQAAFSQAQSGARIVDATGLVNWQRLVKSDAELAFMRKAASITEAMVDGVIDRIVPGLAKNALIAEIQRDAIRGVGGAWGDYAAIVPLAPSGADAAAPHLTWDGRPLRSGEATSFELSGCYRRYHAPLCRSIFLGRPPDHVRRAEAAVLEGIEAGLDKARPGYTAGDIARALFAALRRAGIERSARCGYPVGLSYPPDWGERTVSLRPSDETELKPGMTFHFMPGLWMPAAGDDPGWGLAVTETILIRQSGPAACLCDRPRNLIVKP